MKNVAVCALALLGFLSASAAQAADPPKLSLDLEQSQDLKLEARQVSLEQVLSELGHQLNFTIDFSPLADRATLVSGKFEGTLEELLSQILSNANYIAKRGPDGLSRVVVMATTSKPAASPTTGAENQPAAVEVKSPAQNGAATAQASPRPPAAASTLGAAANAGAGGPPSVVSKLLSSQASAMLPPDPNAAPAAAGAQSLGVLTHVAQGNVQALVSALNAACIGSGCSH
jgi:hypothetical protein